MPTAKSPRKGSLQFWPRKRAKKFLPRVNWKIVSDENVKGLKGFICYKAGMKSAIVKDSTEHSMTKGKRIAVPVTILECPSMKIFSVRFYNKEIIVEESLKDKELKKKVKLPKVSKKKLDDVKLEEFDNITVIVYSQVKKTNLKKTPDLSEISVVGNDVEEKLKFVKENVGKEISVSDIFEKGQLVDVHGITKAKGFQGPVKRFGVSLRRHKSEKTKRGPGSLGGWQGQAHFMYRVAHAGRMGYHQRIDSNKLVIKVSDEPKEINPKGGFIRYGNVKNTYVLIKGSIAGTSKRSLIFTFPLRGNLNNISTDSPQVQYISLESKQ